MCHWCRSPIFGDGCCVGQGKGIGWGLDRCGCGRLAYVVSEDRVATRRQIQTGAYSLGAVEILSGLEPGETIVISNLDPFRGADTVLLTD